MNPIIQKNYADNGSHSYWSVIDRETGETIIDDIEKCSKPKNIDKKESFEELNLGPTGKFITDRKKLTLQESMDQVFSELMNMTLEEFRVELDKPVENGIGDLLVESGIDLVAMLKSDK